MASKLQDPELPNLPFTKLNSIISLYTPPASPPTSPSSSSTDPTTIIFCPWMGASPRSRALHAAYHKHHALYPSARILVVNSLPSWFSTTPTSTREKQILPAIAAIEADPAGEGKRVLVHLFSNGGNVAFNGVAVLYRQQTGRRLPVQALAIDSAPGGAEVRRAWKAMRVGLPRGLFWWPAAGAMWLVILVMWFWIRMLNLPTLLDEARDGLLEFDIMYRSAKRLYLYGKKDELVNYRVVESAVRDAVDKGIDVKTYVNERDPHVQFMIRDEERYWREVEALWDRTRK